MRIVEQHRERGLFGFFNRANWHENPACLNGRYEDVCRSLYQNHAYPAGNQRRKELFDQPFAPFFSPLRLCVDAFFLLTRAAA
jgi:hypothetical protein